MPLLRRRSEPPTFDPTAAPMNVKHTFIIPRGGAPVIPSSGKGNGIDGWSPTVVETSVPLGNVRAFRQPVPDIAPEETYKRWNSDVLARAHGQEDPQPELFQEDYGQAGIERSQFRDVQPVTPYYAVRPLSRPTTSMSPSNWRFLAVPDGIMRSHRHLTGIHFSMASQKRNYPLGGMQAPRRFRNTYRLEPPNRDALNVDMPSEIPGVVNATYAQNTVLLASSRSGRLM